MLLKRNAKDRIEFDDFFSHVFIRQQSPTKASMFSHFKVLNTSRLHLQQTLFLQAFIFVFFFSIPYASTKSQSVIWAVSESNLHTCNQYIAAIGQFASHASDTTITFASYSSWKRLSNGKFNVCVESVFCSVHHGRHKSLRITLMFVSNLRVVLCTQLMLTSVSALVLTTVHCTCPVNCHW